MKTKSNSSWILPAIICPVIFGIVYFLASISQPAQNKTLTNSNSSIPTTKSLSSSTIKSTASGTTKPTTITSSTSNTTSNCNIKGNISYSTGEKIYHMPGQRYYNSTIINSAYGERWFCSEAEAKAAGWRKSKV